MTTFSLTPAQLAAGFALLGRRPSMGALGNLPPVDPATATGLLRDTDLVTDGGLTPQATSVLSVLAEPARIVTSTVITAITTGVATSTFHAPADGGPFVAVATTGTGYDLAPIGTAAEVSAVIGGYLGLAGDPRPLEGDAVELTAGAWSILAALADTEEEAPDPPALRRALARRGAVANAMHTIAPAGATDPGSAGFPAAANWLDAAGITVQTHDGLLRPTRQGRAVLRALRQFAVAGTITVDHVTAAGPVRVASLSSIRSPERLFFGAWKVGDAGPIIALGEPGADEAASMIRSIVEAASVLPVPDATDAAAPGAASQPAAPPPPPAPTTRSNPEWVRYLVAVGLVVALIGAILGFTADDQSASTAPATTVATSQVTLADGSPADDGDGASPIGIVALIAAAGLGGMAVVSWRKSRETG